MPDLDSADRKISIGSLLLILRFSKGADLDLKLARFYDSDDDFLKIYQRLKMTPCPHCKVVGTLILNGIIHGYAEFEHHQRAVRARRVICNARKRHNNGCGHAFAVWSANTIKRLCLSANTLWAFIKGVLSHGNKALALKSLDSNLSPSAPYRIWNRFLRGQSNLRSALIQLCKPPKPLRNAKPVEQTVAHLDAAFPLHPCPISAFQRQLQISFF